MPKRKLIREYARHRADRGLPGGTHQAVREAIQAGRISVDGNGAIVDFERADAEWAASTRDEHVPHSVRPPDGEYQSETAPATLESRADALRRRAIAEAELKELELARMKGRFCLATAVERGVETVFIQCRTRLLAIPSRARQTLPHLTLKDLGTLEDLIREALEELSGTKASEIRDSAKREAQHGNA